MSTKPIISLVASANRIEWWTRFYNSLQHHQTPFEVIFVGDRKPNFELPPNMKHIYATCKPCQCYEIGFRAAQGELIHWTADDASYNYKGTHGDCLAPLDVAYKRWLAMEEKYGQDKKSVVAFRPIEDGGDVWNFHHFFGGWIHTPVMAPFALIHRDYFVNKLGGYDRRFVSGQSENDVIMRVYEDGGRVEIAMDAMLYVHHRQVHPPNPKENKFRRWYDKDREILENCWVVGGYGFYERLNSTVGNEEAKKQVKIATKRQLAVERFEDTPDIYIVSQGEKGQW
jgi:hypothetical protein